MEQMGVLLSEWHWDASVLAGIIAGLVLYSLGLIRLGQRPGGISARRVWQTVGYLTSLAAIFFALESPIDALSDQLFSAHMLQHVLLMHVAAPLMALSSPLTPLLMALTGSARLAVGRWWGRGGGVRSFWRALNRPLVVWSLYAGVLWFWHAPVFYTAALENETIHIVEHFSFFFAALLFWWKVIHGYAPRWRLRGYGVLFLLAEMAQGEVLGALLTYAPTPWYPVYQGQALLAGISALTDQQVAGLVMFAADGLVFSSALLWMTRAWMNGMDRHRKEVSAG